MHFKRLPIRDFPTLHLGTTERNPFRQLHTIGASLVCVILDDSDQRQKFRVEERSGKKSSTIPVAPASMAKKRESQSHHRVDDSHMLTTI